MRKPKFIGVYSQGNAMPEARKSLYFAWELPDASYAIQEIDKAFLPRGKPKRINAAMLRANFRSEPSILAAPVSVPNIEAIAPVSRKTAVAATELTDDALAQLDNARKAKQVENDLRNSFSRALRALNRPRDRKGAIAALRQIAETTKGIAPTHKHMFRDFGVSLRKKSLPELALVCARRVLELAPNDDHAHFNMARILSILGMYDEASAHLKAAMKLDASESVYQKLAGHIKQERETDPRRRDKRGI